MRGVLIISIISMIMAGIAISKNTVLEKYSYKNRVTYIMDYKQSDSKTMKTRTYYIYENGKAYITTYSTIPSDYGETVIQY